MAITKSTSTTFLTSSGVEYPTLSAAKHREMADLFLVLFGSAGLATDTNIALMAASTLGAYFVDVSGSVLSTINSNISTVRQANP